MGGNMERFGLTAFRVPQREGPDLGPPPPVFRVGPRRRFYANPWFSGILLGLVVLILVGGSIFLRILAEWLWFESLGFLSVFQTMLFTQVWLFAGAFVVFSALAVANFLVVWRLAPAGQSVLIQGRYYNVRRYVFWVVVVWVLLFAILFGWLASREWETFLRYEAATPFGVLDPLFGEDVGFYVFTLPVWRLLQQWVRNGTVILTLATVGVYGFFGFNLVTQEFRFPATAVVRMHLSVLGAIIMLAFAVGYWLDQYELMFSPRGIVFGATYTDVYAQWVALRLLAAVAAIAAVLLLANVFLQGLTVPVVGVGAWLGCLVLAGIVYPFLVQRFVVQPNELEKEAPYIALSIRYTRQAFGLDNIADVPFPAAVSPNLADIRGNPETINNVRIWDHRPIKDTYNQVQAIRLYYGFNDMDIDRYIIDGNYRQVILAARELMVERLPAQAQTWINQRLQFTHGYGVALSPVNEVTREGLPNFWIKDVPPQGSLPITQPEIYYGESTKQWVVVNTEVPEFDYPMGDTNVYCIYKGDGGILLNSYIRRLAYSTYFRDMNLLISGQIHGDSRLLMRRQIQERVKAVAPFLLLDRDPYIVVADGKLYWIQDAYTWAKRYPYSQPYGKQFNYIRNSVKVVIDAYDGSMKLYIVDPQDAMVQAYRSIFPDLFAAVEAAPASVREHFRYPEDLFHYQSAMYLNYHMTDPTVFYNKEDSWVFPREVYAGGEQQMNPYYLIMRIPGEKREEFLQMLPFNPVGKDNTISWLAARSDGANYGKLIAYMLPKDKLIFGPVQIKARINQDTFISQQITLWGQAGSRVIHGSVLMIPIAQSFIFVEPLYLQAETGQIPELKMVIVAVGERIAMAETLEKSLAKVFGTDMVAPPTVGPPSPPEGPPSTDVAALARSAQAHYTKALEALRAADWVTYDAEIKAMGRDLQQLVELTKS